MRKETKNAARRFDGVRMDDISFTQANLYASIKRGLDKSATEAYTIKHKFFTSRITLKDPSFQYSIEFRTYSELSAVLKTPRVWHNASSQSRDAVGNGEGENDENHTRWLDTIS